MSTIIEIKKKAQRYLKFPVALSKNDIVFNDEQKSSTVSFVLSVTCIIVL